MDQTGRTFVHIRTDGTLLQYDVAPVHPQTLNGREHFYFFRQVRSLLQSTAPIIAQSVGLTVSAGVNGAAAAVSLIDGKWRASGSQDG